MPLEFTCPACRQPVRTPDAAAGKKGKCPECGAIVQIPAVLVQGSMATSPPSASPRSEAGNRKSKQKQPLDGPEPPPLPAETAGDRRGLPWERQPSLDAFVQTLKVVVWTPEKAFRSLGRSGRISNALWFLVAALLVGSVLWLIEVFFVQLGVMLFVQGGAQTIAQVEVPLPWAVFLFRFTIGAALWLGIALLAAAVGGFVMAAIYHFSLLLAGGATAGYQATYRVVAFGTGSVYMLLPIPLVGPFFAVVMYFVVLIYGLMHAHETTGGRAALAVFVPFFLATCCSCTLLSLFGSSLPLFLPPLGR